jgi:Mor family transcriptional regulator
MNAAVAEIEADLLPPLLQDFVRLIGVQATMLLVQRHGGLRIYIPTPERCTDDHHLAHLIGLKNLLKLAEVYGSNEHFQLPKAERALLAVRNARIVADYQTCKTARELAVEYGLTESQIVRILGQAGAKAPVDRRQGKLF